MILFRSQERAGKIGQICAEITDPKDKILLYIYGSGIRFGEIYFLLMFDMPFAFLISFYFHIICSRGL